MAALSGFSMIARADNHPGFAANPQGRSVPMLSFLNWGLFFPTAIRRTDFLVKEGVFIVQSHGRAANSGMHGYHPAEPQKPTPVLCQQSGANPDEIAAIPDVYRLMTPGGRSRQSAATQKRLAHFP